MAAWVKGNAVDVDAAVEAAGTLLSGARAPIVAGLCADVAGIRAAYRLAERIGASLDPAAGDALYAELDSLSTGGGMSTTATETTGRADVVLTLGRRPWDGDLVPSLCETNPSRGRAGGADRSVLALGGPDKGGSRRIAYGIGNAGLAVAVGHLRAFVRGNFAGEQAFGELAGRLKAAQYGVAIYDPAELGPQGVEMLQGLVKDLNDHTRFFALSLADPFQGRAALQLSAWTTGQAPRVGFGRHQPEHDPWRFDSARQVASGEADAALWLAALPAPKPDWLGRLPSVAIVGEGGTEARGDVAEIVLTVGVPGQSTGGALWNARRGAIAYAGPAGDPAAETAAGVIARITDTIGQKTGKKGASC